MISAGEFKNGLTFDMDGEVMQIVEFQHVKPGKGAAFVRTKIRNVVTGAVTERTFNPTEKFPPAFVERREMEYLYNDENLYYFMDSETYEQEAIDGKYEYLLEDKITEATSEMEGSAEYNKELQKLLNSDKYKQQLAEMIEKNAPRKIEKAIDGKIAESITEYTAKMKEEMNTEIQNAIEAFISENSEKLGLTREEMLFEMGYLKEEEKAEGEESSEAESEEEGEEEEEEVTLIEAYESWYDFVFQEKLVKVYYTIFGQPTTAV